MTQNTDPSNSNVQPIQPGAETPDHYVAVGEEYGPSEWREVMIHPPVVGEANQQALANELGTRVLTGSDEHTALGHGAITGYTGSDEVAKEKTAAALTAQGKKVEIVEHPVSLSAVDSGRQSVADQIVESKRTGKSYLQRIV